MPSERELVAARLATLEAEEAFVAVKADANDPKSKAARRDKAWIDASAAVKAARQAERTLREED